MKILNEVIDTLHYLVSTNQITHLQFPLNAPILTITQAHIIYISPFLKAYHCPRQLRSTFIFTGLLRKIKIEDREETS
jgi:hypothetical protein